jgi:RimJ/RimL family protein N-acetyltransferase
MPLRSLPIRTPSLRLRALTAGDAVRMMALNGEPSTRRWLPSHVYADAEVAAARMQFLIGCYASPGDPRQGPFVLAVDDAASGDLLGHVGFSPFDDDVEVSYAIAEASRRRGLGAEALLHGCRWAAQQFNLASVLALTEAENTASRRTLDRAGFVHAGDVVMRFQGSPQTVSRYVWRPAVELPQLEHLRSLEVELHHPGVRCDRQRLEQLLHPDFHEVGRSGAVYDRETVIAHLAAQEEHPVIASDAFALAVLGDGVALLTYRSANVAADATRGRHTWRSSVWLRTPQGWQLRYHQGTAAAQTW